MASPSTPSRSPRARGGNLDEDQGDLGAGEDLALHRQMITLANAMYRALRDAPEGTVFWTMTLRHAAAALEKVHRGDAGTQREAYHRRDPGADPADADELDGVEADRAGKTRHRFHGGREPEGE